MYLGSANGERPGGDTDDAGEIADLGSGTWGIRLSASGLERVS